MKHELLHYYRKFRQHQSETDGGGAWPGEHAIAAYLSAKSHIHFLKRLGDDCKEHKRRSEAAKRGWQKRRMADLHYGLSRCPSPTGGNRHA